MNAAAEGTRDEGDESSLPATSMRLASSSIYPELCDLQYVLIREDGRDDGSKQLSVMLIGCYKPLPSRPDW